MAFNLRNRSFLRELDFTPDELRFLLKLSKDLKEAKYTGTEVQRLKGKNIALIFEKASTRTRCAFEVAAYDQGAHVTYLGPEGSHIGHKETMKDTARVLGRMFDGIEYRGYTQEECDVLAQYAGVPVWNGLTDKWHPTQMLADMLTIMEHSDKPLHQVSFAYLGDGRNNMGNSYTAIAARLGMDFRMGAPKALWPSDDVQEECRTAAQESGGTLTFTESAEEAVKGVDFVMTDVWVSMGEADSAWVERIKLLKPYQVNKRVMELTGNPHAKFMHCLPAFHNRDTEVGEEIFQKYGEPALEVTDEVFESSRSLVFDEAENRMHTIKAVMVATLGS
jgi:ornithine carbamoyltransferase